MNKMIIVNATALKASGALSILKQFIEAIPADGYSYVFFINNTVNPGKAGSNITFVSKNLRSFIRRFTWDAFGVKHWLKTNNVYPLATISLQNTNIRTFRSVPNFVYFHQAIPFFKKRWNPLKPSERLLWFYKNIYSFFIKLLINENTEIFVQTNFIKNGFAKHFDFPLSKIHIVKPKIEFPASENNGTIVVDPGQLNLFYPAVPFIYKNHRVIFKALSILDQETQRKITLHLTCTADDIEPILPGAAVYFKIDFAGTISFPAVLEMYRQVDALVFPSYIEAIGLPLIEAAAFGLPVIAADLPYSREVLMGYAGARFAEYDNPRLWSERIFELFANKGKRYEPMQPDQSDSWNKLFQILKEKI